MGRVRRRARRGHEADGVAPGPGGDGPPGAGTPGGCRANDPLVAIHGGGPGRGVRPLALRAIRLRGVPGGPAGVGDPPAPFEHVRPAGAPVFLRGATVGGWPTPTSTSRPGSASSGTGTPPSTTAPPPTPGP